MKCTTQDTVEQTIFSKIHKKCYTLMGNAPICNGKLLKDFGYTVNTPASRALLDGTYEAPPNSGAAPNILFAENAPICWLVPEKSSVIIPPEQ
jgi:hypothetical protein